MKIYSVELVVWHYSFNQYVFSKSLGMYNFRTQGRFEPHIYVKQLNTISFPYKLGIMGQYKLNYAI